MKNKNIACDTNGFNALKIGLVNENIRDLQGKILTIIDVAFEDKDRAEKVKHMIKRECSDKQSWISKLGFAEEEEEGSGHDNHEEWESGLVPFNGLEKTRGFRL